MVNALLTQLDKLRTRPNVLVVTTSNLSESIDPAFMDRADIVQYVGQPGPQAIYAILRSCLEELGRAGFAQPMQIPAWDAAPPVPPPAADAPACAAWKLRELATQCTGISGRSLRRLPVLAHARCSKSGAASDPGSWIDAMARVAQDVRQNAPPAMGM